MDRFQYGGILFDPSHYQALSYIESKHNNKLFINPDFKRGKAGYMQLSPIAFADLKEQGFFKDREYNSLTPQEVLAGSMKYASRLGEHYGFTDPKWNAAAYNMGPSKARELYDKYGGKLNKAVLDPNFPQTTKDYLFDYNYTTLTKERHGNEDVNKMYDIIKNDRDVNSLNIDAMAKKNKTPKYFWGALIQAGVKKIKEEKEKDKAFMNSSNMGAAGTALGSMITSAGDAIGTQEDASKANVIQGAAVSTLGGLMSGGIMGGLIAAPTSLIKYSANAIAQGSRKETQQEAWINGHTTGIDTGTNYQFKLGGVPKYHMGSDTHDTDPPKGNTFGVGVKDTIYPNGNNKFLFDKYKNPDYIVHTRNKGRELSAFEKTLDIVDRTLSAPSRYMTQAITGKYQDPSEAWGYKDPKGFMQNAANFGIDMIADPMNLLGVGIASKIGKVIKVGDKVADATQVAKKVFDDKKYEALWESTKYADLSQYIDKFNKFTGAPIYKPSFDINDFNKVKTDLINKSYVLEDVAKKSLGVNKTRAATALVNDAINIKQGDTDSYEPHYSKTSDFGPLAAGYKGLPQSNQKHKITSKLVKYPVKQEQLAQTLAASPSPMVMNQFNKIVNGKKVPISKEEFQSINSKGKVTTDTMPSLLKGVVPDSLKNKQKLAIRDISKKEMGGYSIEGYRKDSPDKNKPYVVPVKDLPTRQDSLNLLKNTKDLLAFYKKNNYKNSGNEYKPFKNKKELIDAYNFAATLIDPKTSAVIKNDKYIGIPSTQYTQKYDINKNQFYSRELAPEPANIDAPYQLIDKRILPAHSKTFHKMFPLDNGQMHSDVANINVYDPLQVTPVDMLNAKQLQKRAKLYGNVPKVVKDIEKDKIAYNVQGPSTIIKALAAAKQPQVVRYYKNGQNTAVSTTDKFLTPEEAGFVKKKEKGGYSIEGYKKNSPDKNKPYVVIPGSHISMQDVLHKVLGVGSNGQTQIMMPGQQYNFGASTHVTEFPIKRQKGGPPSGQGLQKFENYKPAEEDLLNIPQHALMEALTGIRKSPSKILYQHGALDSNNILHRIIGTGEDLLLDPNNYFSGPRNIGMKGEQLGLTTLGKFIKAGLTGDNVRDIYTGLLKGGSDKYKKVDPQNDKKTKIENKEEGGPPDVVPMDQITPLQASKDELVIHPNYDVTKTAARKTHAEYTKTGQNEKVSDTLQPLQRDQIGNVIAPGAYVVSNAKELKIPVALAKQMSLGVDPAYYAKDEHLPEAKERNVADEFFNNKKEMTPAELLKSVLKKIPEPKRDSKTDMFAKQTSVMNKAARVPMLEIIKKTNDFLRNINNPQGDEQEAVHNPEEEMQDPNAEQMMYAGGMPKYQVGSMVMPSYLKYPMYDEAYQINNNLDRNGGNVLTGALRTPGDGNPLPTDTYVPDNSSPFAFGKNMVPGKDWKQRYNEVAKTPEGTAINKYSQPAKAGSTTPDYMQTLLQQIQGRKYPGNPNNAALAAMANGFGASMLSALQNPTNEVYATNPTLMDRKFAPEDVNLRTRIYDNSMANRDAITLKGLESTGVSAQKSQFYLQSNDNVEKRNAAVLSAIQANNQLGRAKANAIDQNRRGIVDQNNANQKDYNRYLYNITKPLSDTAGNIGNIYQQDAQNRMAFDDRKERDMVSVQQGQYMMDILNKQNGVAPATSGKTNSSIPPMFKGTTQEEWEAYMRKYNLV